MIVSVIKIQKWYRGNVYRLKRLPQILYYIQRYLQLCLYNCSSQTNDGRINSCIDEEKIIELLIEKFSIKIKTTKIRMWYDILVLDAYYGWLPVNIKTTTTITSDNTGNLAMCVYAYTNELLHLNTEKSYENGKMSVILTNKIKEKKYNNINKKDYYFIIINKNDKQNVIINSVKGLSCLTSNINNIPYQVCWKKNNNFNYDKIQNKIKMFIECLQRPKPSWKELFMTDIRLIQL
jgi:hypothetical protein